MKFKYSISHLMLFFVIVGLICLWNIERQKIDALNDRLNQTTAALKTSVNSTQTQCTRIQSFLNILHDDSHYRDLSVDTRSGACITRCRN